MDRKILKFLFDIDMRFHEKNFCVKRELNCKKFFAFLLISLSSLCYAQKTMVEKLKTNQTLTIHIQYYGDRCSDPRIFFTIQLTKLDSNSYELFYKKGDKVIKRSANHNDLLPLINLEK